MQRINYYIVLLFFTVWPFSSCIPEIPEGGCPCINGFEYRRIGGNCIKTDKPCELESDSDEDSDSVAFDKSLLACTGEEKTNCSDNCPQVANSEQEDRDGDGIGDLCDFSNQRIDTYVWSPNARRLAMVQCPPEDSQDCELWIADYDFSEASLVQTDVAREHVIDWQDDWLLFPKRGQGDKSKLVEYWKIRTNGTELMKVTPETFHVAGEADKDVGTVNWAKFVRGTHWVYMQVTVGQGYSMDLTFLYNAEEPDSEAPLVTYNGNSNTATVSATGGKLFWGVPSKVHPGISLHVTNVYDGSWYQIEPELAAKPVYHASYDGTLVVFNRDGEICLDSIEYSSERDATCLTNSKNKRLSTISQLALSPDGNWLLALEDGVDFAQVYKIHTDGKKVPKEISLGETECDQPSFSPDGRLISYLAKSGESSEGYRVIVVPAE